MSYPSTQLQAWDSIQERLPLSRRQVFLVIASSKDGISTLGIAEKLHWPVNCVSGRITELRKAGVVMDSGRRCINPSGAKGILWVLDKEPLPIKFDESGQGAFC